MHYELQTWTQMAVDLLRRLIATPSFSREEAGTGDILESFLLERGIPVRRDKNNVWALNRCFDPQKPTLLLNSHHDTVRPNAGYTRDPFSPDIEAGKLYGLGSNDAGGPLTCLLAAFLYFYDETTLPWNLIFLASAEEEISGKDGIERVLPQLGRIDCAIVGEPTQMQMAIAEKGLLVLDGLALGKAGHAARDEGENALYKALDDIDRIRHYRFDKVSELLGLVKISVTMINAGTQHNVVPDRCTFTVDVRVNELYTLEAIAQELQLLVQSQLTPRSLRLRSTFIPPDHPLVQAGLSLGRTCYGSPTLSDKALMPFPALKIGPGDSARSHTADEFIYIAEMEAGIRIYLEMLKKLMFTPFPDTQLVIV